ncbi:MAG TPA: ACP S-malonyltransferase [Gemmatimonadaceae bacterium]|jgi:[acyl-carrier-protein] S-malonyltransferase|nr:ACP S-malonyltransferase [Gemmatimonadaceae bacterium]
MDLILLFPGQGSQKPGMGKDLAGAFPAARAVFDEADRTLGIALSALCFEGPDDQLTSTQNAQPALLAHGAAAWTLIREHALPHVRAAAGHSLGEFTAYHAAGTLSLDDALRVVRTRGELMFTSGVERPGAMAAILGLAADAVERVCATATAEGGVVVPANYNTPEQVVVSGEIAAVERAMALAKEAGAKRAIRLNVSGAFHSPLMEVAAAGLERALDAAAMRVPSFPVSSNVSAEPVRDATAAKALLVRQLTSPVRWTALVQRLAADHPGAVFVELGPGTVLSNLVKRIVPGVQTLPCGTVADVDALHQRLA